MKLSKKLLLLLSICYFSTIAYSQKIPILGKDLKSKILCDQCTPGSIGQPMVLDIKPWTPILTDNSNPKQIASQLLGRVYINGDETGDQPTFCSNSLQNPFGITNIYPSGNTGNSGTTIKYKWKKIVKLDVGLQVQTDLDNLKKINPKIEKIKLDSFSADLTTAYSRFANKEVTITGKYFEYLINPDDLIALSRDSSIYKECNNLIHTKDLRLVNAIGFVYFDITDNQQSIDDIASTLQTKAQSYGINYSIKFSFKRTVSESIDKFTQGYIQVIVWKSMTKCDLDKLALKTCTN